MIDGLNFSLTYCYKNRKNLSLFLLCHESKGDPSEYVQICQRNKVRMFDIDGINHYGIPVKDKWVRSLSKYTANRVAGLYATLLQYLTEDGIKNLFYDIWIANYNYHQRKKNITEMNKINYLRNRGMIKPKPDSTIIHITQNMGLKEASKMSI